MIQSMTAFARGESQMDTGNLVCELRSINHRYLEINFYLPDTLRALEMPIREHIRDKIKRGKIEGMLRYQSGPQVENTSISINTTLAQELCQAGEKIAALLKSPAPISPLEILSFPGVLDTKDIDIKKIKDPILHVVDHTLKELITVRKREGEDLKQLFLQRIDSMQQELAKVRTHLPIILTEQRERLLKRFNDVKLELDPMRLEQEMVFYAQKLDVAEEIERAETHIAEMCRILKHGGPVGRRLDFLLQELNREANTLGSKSSDTIMMHAAVEMKVLIEQIREQVQNIE